VRGANLSRGFKKCARGSMCAQLQMVGVHESHIMSTQGAHYVTFVHLWCLFKWPGMSMGDQGVYEEVHACRTWGQGVYENVQCVRDGRDSGCAR
jgi:hypothetical protein